MIKYRSKNFILSEKESNVKIEEKSLEETKEAKEISMDKEISSAKSSGSKTQKDFTNYLRKRIKVLLVLSPYEIYKMMTQNIFQELKVN